MIVVRFFFVRVKCCAAEQGVCAAVGFRAGHKDTQLQLQLQT